MESTTSFDLMPAIDGWLSQLHQKPRWTAPRFRPDDLEELRSHLLDQTDDLMAGGKSAEQAFRIAIGQLGEPAYLARQYRKVSYWYVVRQKAWAVSQVVVTSRRVVAFSVVFVAITFGSIFGQKPADKRSKADTIKNIPKADTMRNEVLSKQFLSK